MKLAYINELGPNYKGDNIYECIFSDMDDVWGEDWDAEPASGKPLPPNVEYIRKVGVLKNSEINLLLILSIILGGLKFTLVWYKFDFIIFTMSFTE